MMLAVAATTASRKASAQEPSRSVEFDTVVVTGTRTPERSQRSTVKTDVVTREEAVRRGATNVADALATQPGVQVNPGAYGFLGGISAIQIQGFDLQRVLILEDGEPVVGDIGGGIDLANIPIGDVQRIEIVTGPTSALYGSSAIGGVVNVLTAPPAQVGPSGRFRADARSHGGVVLQGNGDYRSGPTGADSRGPSSAGAPSVWAGLDANYTRQDGLARTPGVPDTQVPESARSMLGFRAGATLTKAVDVRLRMRWLHDETLGLSSRVAPGVGRYVIERPTVTDRYTLHFIETLSLGRGSNVRITLGRQWVDGSTAVLQQGSSVGDRRQRGQNMQSFEAIGTFADGARTWVVGTRAQVDDFTQSLTKTESLSSGLSSTTTEEVSPVRLGSVAPYGQLQWKFGEALTVLPGVRGEFHSLYGTAVTPRFAASSRLSREWLLRASVGRGFRAPSAKELGFAFDHSTFGYRVVGTSDLRPETSWGTNADLTWQPARAYRLRAGVFMNWVDDLIDLDLASGTAAGGVVDYRYVNFGKARTFGAQLDGSVHLGEFLRADLAYDYLWTRDDLNDRPLSGRPPHTVTTSLRTVPVWKVEGYARMRFVSDAFVSEQVQAPGYSTIDLRVARELWPKSQAYAGVLNLLDVRQDPGRIGDLRPPLGRVFYVGLRGDLPWEEE
jgi:outer membrane receptor for ferrienterochelin and colicins